jgi:hypothetical protein
MPQLKAKDETPESLRPYIFLGVDLNWNPSSKEAVGDCPHCGRESKFSVNIKTGQFKCFVCNELGNSYVFIRKLHEMSLKETTPQDYEWLREHRGLLEIDCLIVWQLAKSILTGDYLVPGYGVKGELNQLYSYRKIDEKYKLLPVPTLGHQLHGMNLYDSKKPNVYFTEGPWDALAIYEVMSRCKVSGESLVPTSSIGSSLLKDTNILATPGCTTFFEKWLPVCDGKSTYILFDNDHPRRHPRTGADIPPAAFTGVKRIVEMLSSSEHPPTDVNWLAWGENGYDLEIPSGFDLRDILKASGNTLGERIDALSKEIEGRIYPCPDAWFTARLNPSTAATTLGLLPCTSYKDIVSALRKAMRWTEGLDIALSVMLSSVISTKSIGDQSWVKIIGPASCGKSTLCELLSASKKYVLAKSTIRGFHSGYGSGDEDHSLISLVNGKTLVTKDGDTLMKAPNIEQILSEARDVYDTVSRTSYRNKASRDYAGIRMTWILCGTSSLIALDQSELGERFLTCIIMDGIDDDLEDEITWRVANRANRNMSIEADGKPETHQEPEMTLAMQLTGGYVEYLRENAVTILSSIEMSDSALRRCTRLGKITAFLRARPSSRQEEHSEREFAARLVSQFVRLAKCLAAVLNCKEVNEEVMRRATKVCLDTGRGPIYDIAKYLYEAPEEGIEIKTIAAYSHKSDYIIREFLRFMRKIGMVESLSLKTAGVKLGVKWKLTKSFLKLYTEVHSEFSNKEY